MLRRTLLALSGIIFLMNAAPWASATVPVWTVGNEYGIDQVLRASGEFSFDEKADGSFSLDFTASGNTFTVSSIETKAMNHGGGSHEVYVVTYTGTADATGSVTYPPLPETPARIQGASINGEFWVRTADLASVMRKRVISGDLEADFGGGFVNVGSFSLEESEDYVPPFVNIQMEPNVGDTWNVNMTVYAYGMIGAELDIPGMPIDPISEEFDISTDFVLDAETVGTETKNGEFSYKAVATDTAPGSEMFQNYWYAPSYLWFSGLTIQQLAFDDPESGTNITIDELTMDVNYFINNGSDPTPTPPPEETGAYLSLNDDTFSAGEPFNLDCRLINNEGAVDVDLYILMMVGSEIFWYPGWTQNIDWTTQGLPGGSDQTLDILDFTWPTGAGSFCCVEFYAAMFNQGFLDVEHLIGEIGYVQFGWE